MQNAGTNISHSLRMNPTCDTGAESVLHRRSSAWRYSNALRSLARISVLACALFMGSPAPAEPSVETWTSRAGTEIEAAFIEVDDRGIVTLRSAEGEQFQIAAEALNEAGRERVRELAREQRDARLAEARRLVNRRQAIIPEAYVRDDDTELGRFESRNITAIVYQPSGAMDLFIKENGEHLSPPVRFGFSVNYRARDPGTGRMRTYGRPRTEWIEPPEFRGNTARFRMMRRHDVEVEIVYEFRNDGVDVGYRVVDPDGIEHRSRARIGMSFPAIFHEDRSETPPRYFSPRFPRGADRETFFASTEDYEIRRGTGGRASGARIPFNRSVHSIGSGHWFEVGGGVYGRHTLRIERPRRGGSLSTYIYRNNLPAQGWSLRFDRSGHANPIQATDMLSVTVR